jgi:hypothetical protein
MWFFTHPITVYAFSRPRTTTWWTEFKKLGNFVENNSILQQNQAQKNGKFDNSEIPSYKMWTR